MNAELGHDNNITLAGGRTARNWQQNFTLRPDSQLHFLSKWHDGLELEPSVTLATQTNRHTVETMARHNMTMTRWPDYCNSLRATRKSLITARGDTTLLMQLAMSSYYWHFEDSRTSLVANGNIFCNISPMNLLQLPDFSFTLKYKCYLIASIILLLRGLYQTAFMKAL